MVVAAINASADSGCGRGVRLRPQAFGALRSDLEKMPQPVRESTLTAAAMQLALVLDDQPGARDAASVAKELRARTGPHVMCDGLGEGVGTERSGRSPGFLSEEPAKVRTRSGWWSARPMRRR
jgi:hypothetical protein